MSLLSRQTPTLRQPEGLLAHYTSAEGAFEKVLVPDGKLKLGRYRDMNDPAEAQDLSIGFAYSGDGGRDEGFRLYGEMLQVINEIRGSRRLLCLTRDVPETDSAFACCWARPRMWEQYGDHRRGACLVFDQGKLRNTIHAQMPQQERTDEPTLHIGAVEYTPGGFADRSDAGTIVGTVPIDDPRAAVAQHIDRHYRDFYFLKTDDWASEYEYRILLASGTDELHAFIDYRDSLVAVVVGYRFPPYQLPGARALCDARGVQLRRMWWEGGHPFALGSDGE